MAKMCAAIAAMVAVVALLQTSAAETEHVVGGEQGWKVPPEGGTPYKTWADKQEGFVIGDVLVFNFPNEEPDVVRVTRVAFESCNSTETLAIAETNPFEFVLEEPRKYYFIGTTRQGCFAGQNLTVTVTVTAPSPEDPSPHPEGHSKEATASTGKTTKETKKQRKWKQGIR